uniref:Panish n=1 Tax=Chironomus riparius TaxID=315576 RepID=A0A0F7KN39_9DIPT|nr:panish [Chironomus riparius]
MNNFPNSNNLYGYGFQQSSQQLNYPPPIVYYNVDYNNAEPQITQHNQHKKQAENVSNSKSLAIRKCRARYGLEKKHEWCRACCQKKKCTRYKNDEEESPPNIVSPESNTVYYPVYNVYRPYMPLVNVMLGY